MSSYKGHLTPDEGMYKYVLNFVRCQVASHTCV